MVAPKRRRNQAIIAVVVFFILSAMLLGTVVAKSYPGRYQEISERDGFRQTNLIIPIFGSPWPVPAALGGVVHERLPALRVSEDVGRHIRDAIPFPTGFVLQLGETTRMSQSGRVSYSIQMPFTGDPGKFIGWIKTALPGTPVLFRDLRLGYFNLDGRGLNGDQVSVRVFQSTTRLRSGALRKEWKLAADDLREAKQDQR